MEGKKPPIPLSSIPNEPGVYRFIDSQGKIIYIGKAKDLRKRVSSYFQKSYPKGNKVSKMVDQAENLEYSIVPSETDALLMENNLIKLHQPKYNALLKDGKSFPFVFVTKEPFPRAFKLRNKTKQKGEYYGPYTSVKAQKLLVDFIQKLFKIRTCSLPLNEKNIKAGKFKVCLEYHLGNCLGPCEGLQSEEDYNDNLDQAKRILKGKWGEVKEYFKSRIDESANGLDFEKAQELKTYFEKLESFRERSLVTNLTHEKHEVITLLKEKEKFFCNYLKVSEGSIIKTKNFIIQNPLKLDDKSILEIARNSIETEENESFESILTNIKMENIENNLWHSPQKGEKKNLVLLSLKNCKEFFLSKLKSEKPEKINPGLLELKEALNLKTLPKRIECFDNSNIQGSNPVASMVCFLNGYPAKKEYRHFNVKTVTGPDDFESMREVVGRRYKRVLTEGTELPDLVVIDGGKGQLSSAWFSMKELGLDIPIIGIAKKLEELYKPEDPYPLMIGKKSPALKIIQRLRNEAHRFAINHHRNRRSKSALETGLINISGMGEKTQEKILRHFGSLKQIKEASEEEIVQIIGRSKAKLISEAKKKGVI